MPNLTLAQFDQYTVGAPGTFSIDPFTGIDNSSVQHVHIAAIGTVRLAVPKDSTGVPKGITVGAYNVALKWSTATITGGVNGMSFAQSADNVANTGACYAVEWRRTGSVANRIRVVKRTSGGVNSLGTEVAFATFTETAGPITLRVTWDLTTGAIEVFRGTALDYSDLTSIIQYNDPSPLSSPVAEGFYVSNLGGEIGGTHTSWFDNLMVETFD